MNRLLPIVTDLRPVAFCFKLFMSLAGLVTISVLSSCISKPEPLPEKLDACFCGPLVGSIESCGLWNMNTSQTQDQLIDTKKAKSDTCQPTDCGRLFPGRCKKLKYNKLALKLPSKPLNSACYCDERIVSIGGQDKSVCAAWHPDYDILIEYHESQECLPKSCGDQPFVYAPQVCQAGFQSFYENLGSDR